VFNGAFRRQRSIAKRRRCDERFRQQNVVATTHLGALNDVTHDAADDDIKEMPPPPPPRRTDRTDAGSRDDLTAGRALPVSWARAPTASESDVQLRRRRIESSCGVLRGPPAVDVQAKLAVLVDHRSARVSRTLTLAGRAPGTRNATQPSK